LLNGFELELVGGEALGLAVAVTEADREFVAWLGREGHGVLLFFPEALDDADLEVYVVLGLGGAEGQGKGRREQQDSGELGRHWQRCRGESQIYCRSFLSRLKGLVGLDRLIVSQKGKSVVLPGENLFFLPDVLS
jgi:hypothetical protein